MKSLFCSSADVDGDTGQSVMLFLNPIPCYAVLCGELFCLYSSAEVQMQRREIKIDLCPRSGMDESGQRRRRRFVSYARPTFPREGGGMPYASPQGHSPQYFAGGKGH